MMTREEACGGKGAAPERDQPEVPDFRELPLSTSKAFRWGIVTVART